eukprot:7734681-Alexandrium_andersonii.AAC.1
MPGGHVRIQMARDHHPGLRGPRRLREDEPRGDLEDAVRLLLLDAPGLVGGHHLHRAVVQVLLPVLVHGRPEGRLPVLGNLVPAKLASTLAFR